jgi:uncharacterized protein
MTVSLPNLPVLVVPGKGNSESTHWQSWLERRLLYVDRVEQKDWDTPQIYEWADNIAAAVARSVRPPLLVAHSFGCLATAFALQRMNASLEVAGAILVAPADPRRFDLPDQPLLQPLPCRSLVVISDNDPWMSRPRSQLFANAWQANTYHAGALGHINVASGFGPWPRLLRWIEHWQIPLDETPRFRSVSEHLRNTIDIVSNAGLGVSKPSAVDLRRKT